MAYLSNTSITIDAILTKKGRELLAQGGAGGFNITQFALGDDEIDYTLWNSGNDKGSNYYGEAIENLPTLEVFPDENAVMKSRLVTLPRGTSTLPVLSLSYPKITLNLGQTFTIDPKTLNYTNVDSNQKERQGYIFTIGDARLLTEMEPLRTSLADNINRNNLSTNIRNAFRTTVSANSPIINTSNLNTFSRPVSQTVNNTLSLRIKATNSTALFTNNATKLTTTVTITGIESGARITIPIVIQKNVLVQASILTV